MAKKLEDTRAIRRKVRVSPRSSVDIVVKNYSGFKIPLTAKHFKLLVKNALRFSKLKGHIGIGVVFVKKKYIKELNRLYRHKNKPTDVLSFGNIKEGYGDIIICPEIAYKERGKFGLSKNPMISKLFVHAFFHFLGYNHIKKAEKEKMASLEDKVIKSIKFKSL